MRSLARRARPAVPNYVGDLSLIRLRLSRFASTCIRGAAGDRRGAAGVSAQFRQPTHLLLTKPAAATAMGWGGEVWNLRGAPHGFLGHQAATANSSSTVSTTTANSTDSTRGGGGKTGTTGTRDEGGGDGREKWARGGRRGQAWGHVSASAPPGLCTPTMPGQHCPRWSGTRAPTKTARA